MATLLRTNLQANNSTTTDLRAWAQFIEDTLIATGGWTATTDIGQTLPSALTVPGAASTKVGFRIYRMTDTLQATNPVFLKIHYGSGEAANVPGIWLTIGTGSDGSGNITGTVWNGAASAAPNISGRNATSGAATNSYGSAGPNRACMCLFVQAINVNIMLVWGIERSKDATGADTGDGLMLSYYQGNPASSDNGQLGRSRYVILAGGTQPIEESGLSYVVSRQNPSQTWAPGDIGVGVIIHFKGVAQQPGLNFLITNVSDVSNEGNLNLTMYGGVHTYQQLGILNVRKGTSGSTVGNIDSNARVLMRFD